MLTITGTVGKKGANAKSDVKIIQLLINQKITPLKPIAKLRVDGIAGGKTIQAIEDYQRRILHFSKADGRVDPGGKTFKSLAPNYAFFTISGADIHPKAKAILTEILLDAGLSNANITSGVRTPADQARIMYDNIKRRGINYNYRLYGTFGDKVIKVFEENAEKERAEVIALMQSEIENVGPAKVSKHCSDTHFVFDVAPSSISDNILFVASVNRHQAVSKLLQPPSDPAFHIEIQKNSPFI